MSNGPSARDGFPPRHLGPDEPEQAEMLALLGLTSLDELVQRAVPTTIRDVTPLDLPAAAGEVEVLDELAALAARNRVVTSLIGMGYADTVTPPVILRNVLESPAWYTAYTPYQPEISQGRLEALLNFQTMVSDLTGMELSNASLLDEATAAAEAMTLCHRVNGAAGDSFFVDEDCHPQTIAVVKGRAEPLGLVVVVGDPDRDLPADGLFGALLQYPGSSGALTDPGPRIRTLHERGALVIVAVDLLALLLVTPPGALGADVVVGSSQRFGVPLGFGGPHAAFLATRDEYKRDVPGRIVGVSVDGSGRRALRLALQTREQHIRRERATSNICTAQVLLAVIAGCYAVYHGPEGLRAIATRVHRLAAVLAAGLRGGGVEVVHDHFFDTVRARVVGRARAVTAAALELGINVRLVDDDHVGISLDETTTGHVIEDVWRAFGIEVSAGALEST
ncbi:MAG: glycine dehydrogenase (aminomethyl-transferring), partial [Thermoplasmata archaeon]|nr:glycine dehydrogenase (aminomethyl-transferring) [Thermoplasmata archaeon]